MFNLLKNIQKKLYISRKRFNYPFTGHVDKGVIHNGNFSCCFKVITMSTELLGEEYYKLTNMFESIINICDIRIQVVSGEYFIYLFANSEKQLKDHVEKMRSTFTMQDINIEVVTAFATPKIITEQLIKDYVNDGECKRVLYVETTPIISKRYLDTLQYILNEEQIYFEYSKLNKTEFIKKIDKAHKHRDFADSKNISEISKLDYELENSSTNIGVRVGSTDNPISMKIFIVVSAKSLKKLNEKCNKIKNELYNLGFIIKSFWGEQIEAYLHLHPLASARLKRNTSFDNWQDVIAMSMPFVKKTMHLGCDINIGSLAVPLTLTQAKSMFIIGRTRMGKTYCAKKILRELIARDYNIQIIDRNTDDNLEYDYSDVAGTRYKVDYNDYEKFCNICTDIFQKQITNSSKNTLIVVDEAWQFIQESDKIRDIVQRIARDGSKFNLGIMFITQSIRDLQVLAELGVVEQIATRIFFGLPDKVPENLCRDEFELSDEAIHLIQSFTQGECIIQMSSIKYNQNQTCKSLDYCKII